MGPTGRSRRETFTTHASVMKEFGVISHTLRNLLISLKSSLNKGWVRRVPAAAVIPAPQVVTTFIGLEAFVAGSISF